MSESRTSEQRDNDPPADPSSPAARVERSEDLRRDANRYRFLRNQPGLPSPEEFDSAIDADMRYANSKRTQDVEQTVADRTTTVAGATTEQPSSEQRACEECGMLCALDEYHPYAACLMFKGCHDAETVRANLAAAAAYGAQYERDAIEAERNRTSNQELADMPTPKAQSGTWTLIAPDGRQWQADSPLKCCALELRERVPAEVALARIFREATLQDKLDALPPDRRAKVEARAAELIEEQRPSKGLFCSYCCKGEREILVFLYADAEGICDKCVDRATAIVADQRAKRATDVADERPCGCRGNCVCDICQGVATPDGD